jgi:choice-of-anchor B domain-containing protein
MKKIILLALLFVSNQIANAQVYDAQNISLLGHWDGGSLTAAGTGIGNRYSGVYGYEQAGIEYAILGNANKTYFINIDNQANPIVVDSVAGALANCVWREYRVFQHYVYAVSDDAGGNRFQIIDMQYLPDSVHVVMDNDLIASQVHTIFIEDTLLYGGSVTYADGTFSAMSIWSIANPEFPVLLRELNDDVPAFAGHVHDMFAHNDTVYMSCGYDGLQVVTFNRSTKTLTPVGSMTAYPYSGYNHSSVMMDDNVTLIMADEVPADLPLKSVNVSDMSDLQVQQTIPSKYNATPHNPYNAHYNNRCFVSCYQDGLMIYDVTQPNNLVLTGYFDSHYETVGTAHEMDLAYKGNWGAYMFSNRNIILGDMQHGLYILDASLALNNPSAIGENPLLQNMSVYPTLVQDQLTISSNNELINNYKIEVKTTTGQTVASHIAYHADNKQCMITLDNAASGVYFVQINDGNHAAAFKFIKE